MSTAVQRMTIEQYWEMEERSEERHEFYAGEIFQMVGGSFRHAQLMANILRELGNALKSTECVPLTGDMRIACPTGLRTYPDASVVCGKPIQTEGRNDEIQNPILLVEVLSPSTEAYDRGRKFFHYRSIPSLREYLLIAQDDRMIDQYVRQPDDTWMLTSHTAGSLALPSLGCELKVDDIYWKFDEVEA